MDTEKSKVLVIDDEESCRKINQIILTEGGFEVDLAEDGLAGWEKIRQKNYDLILIDRMMPRMSGDELLVKLKENDIQVPTIILSALGDQVAREDGIYLGANQYINKANENFGRELLAWSNNLIKEYREKQAKLNVDKHAKVQLLKNLGKVSDQLKKIELSNHNNTQFISFEIEGANWEGDYATLCRKLTDSIESLDFQNWEKLRVSLLLKVNQQIIRVNLDAGSEEEKIMEDAFNRVFVEVDKNMGDSPVRVVWSVPWETQEEDEGMSLLIYNLPPKPPEEDFTNFGMDEEESDRELVQGATYRFLEYAARVIGNYEIQRKFKDLVYSASEHLNKSIQEMESGRQRQMQLFESIISEITGSDQLNLSENDQQKIESILDKGFNSFLELEMGSLNDVQYLLKWVRKLQLQFKEKEDLGLTEESDADQIGGEQTDVDDLLAQFDM